MLQVRRNIMHLRHRLTLLTVISSILLGPLAGFSQTSAGTAHTPCITGSVDHPCPSAAVSIPYPSTPPTFESMERQVALVQSQPTPPPRARLVTAAELWQREQAPHANPEAPDQSELLKNAKDSDFIRRNFKTMFVVTKGFDFFDAQQMKAALRRNPDFQKLNIEIVDDRHVADTVLIVTYTFAWDYPFELQHQNTTTVLLAGKGEGPFSGPLGAADVAREFVKAAKPWRVTPAPKK
jgi:hypothetical protein